MQGAVAARLLPLLPLLPVLPMLLLGLACSQADPLPGGARAGEVQSPGAPQRLAVADPAGPPTELLDVPRSEWLRVEADLRGLPEGLEQSVRLACSGRPWPVAVQRLSPQVAIVNPAGELPAEARCELVWAERGGAGSFVFRTAAAGAPAQIPYSPGEDAHPHAFPDDFFTQPDPGTRTGLRLAIPLPAVTQGISLWHSLAPELVGLDGFSPIAHLVFELPAALDPDSVPRTPADSLDPLASVALLDLDPASPRYGARVPFRLELRRDVTRAGLAGASALVFPSIPLEPGGRYGLIVSRRARIDAGRPLAPSPALAAALAPQAAGEGADVARIRALLAPLLEVSEQRLVPAMPRDDIAFALRFTVRSLDSLPADLLAMREQVLRAEPPAWSIDSVEPVSDAASPFVAVVHGTWQAPDWRLDQELARDDDGRPRRVATQSLPFTLALPRSAEREPAPVVLYQHGSPGSAEQEVPAPAQEPLAAAGLAVIGVSDVLNREIGAHASDPETSLASQLLSLLLHVLGRRHVPDYWLESTGEQIAFLRVIAGLGELDVLPLGASDGVPDLDVDAPLGLLGVSQGANQAPALLAHAPEIRAAVLVSPGARLTEMLIHQRPGLLVDTLSQIFPELTPTDVWVAMALFQTALDRQDAHNHARFLSGTSVLVIAGQGDSLVPEHASDSLAFQLGLPLLGPDARGVSFLETARAPLRANLAPGVTGAYVSFVPTGVAGVAATPGCRPPALSPAAAREGHSCAQLAAESLRLRAMFLRSAAAGGAPLVAAY